MKHPAVIFPFLLILFASLFTGPLAAQTPQRNWLFNQGWKFYKGDIPGGEKKDLDDSKWRKLDLPHDWSIEDLPGQKQGVIGPFSLSSVGGTSTGYTVGGTGWYRKHFKANTKGNKKISIYFDGVYMDCDVWINGMHLGNHPYGYTGFSYDLTPYLIRSANNRQNVLAVRVRNEGKNSRWYSGSGIYRHVRLTTTGPIYFAPFGIFLSSHNVSQGRATVSAKIDVVNKLRSTPVTVVTRVKDKNGKTVAIATSKLTVEKNPGKGLIQNLLVKKPRLWSPDQPYLYKVEMDIRRAGRLIDRVVQHYGIRSIQFSATKGFLLNGKKTLLRGGSVHHDNGPLGSVAINRAEERKVELLKGFGFNAVRTSHNPPSQEFLNACDRLGLLVINEVFDQWQKPKNPQDYHRFFNNWWRNDITSWVKRDRNHPSVIMWSIGNEIKERVDASGLAITKQLKETVHALDGTRPVTEAICNFWDNRGYKWDTSARAFSLLDVGAYNYMWQQYEADHAKHPDRIIVGTESFANDAFKNWQLVEKHPYVIGDFVWTAMDYMGETGIGHAELDTVRSVIMKWPWFNAYCGDIDLIGGKKPQSYFRDVVWKRRKLAMLVHAPIPAGHKEVITAWGWPNEYPGWNFAGNEGKQMQVNIYSNYRLVRVELNGKNMGEKPSSPQTKLTATFNVAYEPGVLKAFGIENGRKVDSFVLRTTGKPARIRLKADRRKLKADRNDLSYVTAEILDAAGRVVPDAVVPIRFSIAGNAEIAATGNANPSEMASFKQPRRNTFRGRCLVIVRPKGKTGKVKLMAESKGLVNGEIRIDVIR